jgi:hypothetical protein
MKAMEKKTLQTMIKVKTCTQQLLKAMQTNDESSRVAHKSC